MMQSIIKKKITNAVEHGRYTQNTNHVVIILAMGSRYFWLIARWRWYATQIFTVPEVASFTCKFSTALATKQHNRNKANGIFRGFVS